jgi:hypothetical protein
MKSTGCWISEGSMKAEVFLKAHRLDLMLLTCRIVLFVLLISMNIPQKGCGEDRPMIDKMITVKRLTEHLRVLTKDIGDRSVHRPENLKRTENYIKSFYRDIGIKARSETYHYYRLEVANVVAEIAFSENPQNRYVLGAHYDSVAGTVGADDNGSAVAVQLETARWLNRLKDERKLDLSVCLVSFALEEPPVYGSRFMGSRVYARRAKKSKAKIDGMICLEMVGYTCQTAGCQDYPFPLMYLGYPEKGDFIGIVGNLSSLSLTRDLARAFRKNPALPVVKLTVPFGGWLMPAVRLSDHASFWDQGFKAVMVTDSAFYRNPHYHLSSDSMEKLDYVFMAELVEGLLIFFTSHGPQD